MKNVLIVEDESLVALEISSYIKSVGFCVSGIASSALEAYKIVDKNDIDLILMDVLLKGDEDGVTCAKNIKNTKDIPIIYISAFSDDETLNRAIQTDPSSYLIKPFNRKELKVAMNIATKHHHSALRVGDIIFDDEFSFDSASKELIMQGEVVHLTRQERQLLSLLIESKNNVVDIYTIENEIWPDKQSNENTRRALISRLRLKLKYKFLQTVHSVGYKITV
ncbi:MAG: response regulator transcription factor [Epsilonproteobacteria bacterium]|nr:response regulator transcription factor [Campylobacterota bacterium]